MALIQEVEGTPGPVPAQAQKASLTSQLMSTANTLSGTLMRSLGLRFDPAPAHLFYVELSGILAAAFVECSGLTVSREVEEVVEGGVNDHTHKLPGRVHYEEIVLRRGLGLSRGLWDWFQQGRFDLHVKRINFSIIQGAPGYNLLSKVGIGSGFGKVKHWNVENAFPTRWELSPLNAASNGEVVIETLAIAHHGLTLSFQALTPLSMLGAVTGR